MNTVMAFPSSFHCPPNSRRPARRSAFTLVEMLTVMTIVTVLVALVTPAVSSFGSAGAFTGSTYTIVDSLEKARAYAMANNTYVWVGLSEQDASSSGSAGIGTVIVAIVASTDGTCAYGANDDVDNPALLDATKVKPVDRSLRLSNLHLATVAQQGSYAAASNAAAGMSRSAAASADQIGESACVSATPFVVPVNGVNQIFSKVIEFNPQGVARIVLTGSSSRAVPDLVEIFLLPTKGNLLTTNVNASAIQVSGLTGAVHALMGMLPLGSTQNADASKVTAATNIASVVISDLRSVGSGAGPTPLYQLTFPTAGVNQAPVGFFVSEAGEYVGPPTAVVQAGKTARYRVSVFLMPPQFPAKPRESTVAYVRVSEPAVITSANASGVTEIVTNLLR